MTTTRRAFLQRSGRFWVGTGLTGGLATLSACSRPPLPGPEELVVQSGELFFNISLAEFSLHRMLWYGEIDHLDFAAIAKRDFGIDAVEYVTMFFNDKAKNHAYLDEMKQRADDLGVRGLLIMVDMQGNLVSKDQAERTRALQSHYAWVEAAQRLGCHSIRVNLPGKGTSEEIAGLAVESLGTLAEFAIPFGINILVEPHGGYSSNGAWLADVMRRVGRDNCGTLPDFGNFVMSLFPYRSYDRYKGVEELMPYAKGVSAKSSRFDDDGNDMVTDFYRMLKIVKDAGFTGHMGIEYEGSQLSEYDGIKATKALLIRAGRAVT